MGGWVRERKGASEVMLVWRGQAGEGGEEREREEGRGNDVTVPGRPEMLARAAGS